LHDQLGGRRPAAVEVDGADDGLHGVGQDRGLLPPAGRGLALAEQQERAQVEAGRHLGEGLGVHQRGPDLGQLAFGQVGVGEEQVVGDHQAQHGVTEELEPLVGRGALGLGAPRPVGQGAGQQLRVGEGPSEPLDERAHVSGLGRG
jgi:hypothetical protein